MNQKRALVMLGVLITIAAVFLIHPISRYQDARCRGALRLLGNAVDVYRVDQAHLPTRLSVLSNELSNPAFLMCPRTGHPPGNFTNADSWTDYIFLNWEAILGSNSVPSDYPLAYDRRLGNHKGKGVNVLRVDGLAFWDPGAKWLAAFADRHPSFRVPIPE